MKQIHFATLIHKKFLYQVVWTTLVLCWKMKIAGAVSNPLHKAFVRGMS